VLSGAGELGLRLEWVASLAHHNPPNQEVAVVLERMAPQTGNGRPLERSSDKYAVLERIGPGGPHLERGTEQELPRSGYSEVAMLLKLLHKLWIYFLRF